LAKIGYQEAEAVVALSPDIKSAIQKLIPTAEVEVMTNIADTAFFYNEISEKLTYPLTIGYFGTLGLANNLTQIIPLLLELQRAFPNNWRFVFAGNGNEKDEFIRAINTNGLNNFITEWPTTNKEGTKAYLQQCHFSYVSFNNVAPILGSGSPNKFFDSIAAGVPVILNFGGWINALVVEKQLGFTHSSSNFSDCAKQIIALFNNPQAYSRAQSNCQTVAKDFDKDMTVSKLVALLKKSGFSD